MYVCVCVHTHVCMCMHAHTHVYTHRCRGINYPGWYCMGTHLYSGSQLITSNCKEHLGLFRVSNPTVIHPMGYPGFASVCVHIRMHTSWSPIPVFLSTVLILLSINICLLFFASPLLFPFSQ